MIILSPWIKIPPQAKVNSRNIKTFIVRYLGDFFDDFMLNNFVCDS